MQQAQQAKPANTQTHAYSHWTPCVSRDRRFAAAVTSTCSNAMRFRVHAGIAILHRHATMRDEMHNNKRQREAEQCNLGGIQYTAPQHKRVRNATLALRCCHHSCLVRIVYKVQCSAHTHKTMAPSRLTPAAAADNIHTQKRKTTMQNRSDYCQEQRQRSPSKRIQAHSNKVLCRTAREICACQKHDTQRCMHSSSHCSALTGMPECR